MAESIPLGKAELEIGIKGDLQKLLDAQLAGLKRFMNLAEGNQKLSAKDVEYARAKAKFLESPKGAQMLRQQVELGKQLADAQKRMDWSKSVAEKGTAGAYFAAFEESISKVSESLSGLFRAGALATGGIGALVASANPSAFSTLRGSFEMVSIQLGRFFVPVVDELSKSLQRLAGWFKGLDEDTRKQITTWAGWIAKAALAAVALKGVLVVVGMMGSALKGLHTIMLGITAHPLIAVTALVAGLAAKWYLARDAAKEASAVMSGVRGPNAGAKPPTAAQALEAMDPAVRARLNAAKDEKERKAILEEEEKKQEKKVEALQAQQQAANVAGVGKPEKEAEFQAFQARFREQFKASPAERFMNFAGGLFGGDERDAQHGRSVTALAQQLRAMGMAQGQASTVAGHLAPLIRAGQNVNLGDVARAPGEVRINAEQRQLEALRIAQGKGKGGKDEKDDFLRNFEVPFQSRYMSSFAAYGEAAQLAALNVGDLDAANLGDQMKNLLEWQREHGDNVPVLQELRGIREALGNMGF